MKKLDFCFPKVDLKVASYKPMVLVDEGSWLTWAIAIRAEFRQVGVLT